MDEFDDARVLERVEGNERLERQYDLRPSESIYSAFVLIKQLLLLLLIGGRSGFVFVEHHRAQHIIHFVLRHANIGHLQQA